MDRLVGTSEERARTHVRTSLLMGPLGGLVVGLFMAGCGPTYPNCDNDEQCHEGEFCVNGRCQDCRDDSHCPTGQRCTDYRCDPIPGWCNSDADCPSDEMCVENFCRPRPVQTEVEQPPPPPQECQLQPAYFAFDESTLDDAARQALEADVACMRERGITQVQVTGMCDPRGTEEYNIALGHRRAQTTRDHLQRLGLSRGAATPTSVGEERATGSDEYGWSRDRRAELSPR